jgi:DNA polymerase III gamma/tau subunit
MAFDTRKQPETRDFERDIARMQKMLEVLKLQYNMYFAGARKDPPARERADLDRLFAYYRNANLMQLAQQFRFNSFANGYTLLREQWGKYQRAKEEGVVADPRMVAALRKAQKDLENLERENPEEVRRKGEAAKTGNAAAQSQEKAAPKESAKAEKPKEASTAPPAKAAKPSKSSLYDEYMKARQAAGELTTIDPAAFERQLSGQREQIMKKYAAKDVIFTVENKNGKVSVKAKVVK